MSSTKIAPTPLLAEALGMLDTGGPRRPTHTHLRALAGALEPVLTAVRRLDQAATSHAGCLGCPVCELRVALRGLGIGR